MKKLWSAPAFTLLTFLLLVSANAFARSFTGITVGAQSGAVTYGVTGSVSFLVTATSIDNGNVSCTPVVSGLPAGVSGSFSPASISAKNTDPSPVTTLTLTTTAATTQAVTGAIFTVTCSTVSNTGSLTVNKKALTVTANSSSKIYGAAVTFAGTEFTASGLVNGNTVTSVTLTSAGAAASATVAGSPYAIVPSAAVGTGLGNYTITYVNGSLTVTARAITVTADAKSKTAGAPDPPLTYQITSGTLVNGDTFSGALTRVAGEAAGTYAIQQGTLALSNSYALTYVSALFTIINPAPTVTGITPNSGPTSGGTSVTITGTNFTGATSVTIGGVAATGVTVVNATTITATTPAGTAGAKNVAVTTPAGTGTGVGLFTYGAAPSVAGITPNSGPTAGGTSVTITGANFTGATAVTIGGAAATGITVVNATTITATTPAGTLGAKNVAVTTPEGTGTGTSLFTYVAAPTVTSIAPNSGPIAGGTSVTLTGTNFTGATAVTIGGVAATGITVVNATTLTATTPAGTPGAKNVAVTAPGGTGTGIGLFTYFAAPTVTTNAATDLYTENGADWFVTLNATASSNGASTTVTFEYGLDTNYGLTIPLPTDPPITLVSGAVNSAVSANLVGLVCNAVFHYRAVATNSAGTTYGSDRTFTTGLCTAPLFGATDCAATRYGSDLTCGAQDVSLTNIAISPGSASACTSGTPVTLDLDFIVNFSSPSRYDIGIFVAKDGKSPTLLPASGGAASCTVGVLPITPQPAPYTQFPDLDGATVGIPGDICGDGSNALSGVVRLSNVTLPCYASPVSAGQLYVPYVVSWDNQPSPAGEVCSSNQFPVPNAKSRCSVPPGTVNIAVVVMPKINKTHSGASFNSGDPVTYTITVFNDSGGTLQQSNLSDPAVTGLAVSGVTCATLNGSTCPTTTVALIQGAGIVIPSANLPNNSSLIFTVTGILSGSLGDTIHNTASITIGGNTNSSTDSITLGSASGSKSFAPASITEGNSSLMTITFTNPTASPVGGVSFSDAYPSGLVNAAIPTPSTTCGGTPTATAGGNTLTFDGGIIPASGSCTVSVYVTSATANSYVNSVSFTPGSLGSASATLAVTTVTTGNFNAFESSTAAGAIVGVIKTKIAGSPFSIDIVAIKNNAQDNSFSKTVKVELLGNTATGIPLDTNNCPTSSTLLQTVTPNPSLSNGRGVANFAAVNDAWRDVRVRITYPLTAPPVQTIACSTDNFAIRPDSLNGLAVKHLDWANPGTGAVSDTALNNLSHAVTGTPNVHKAGRNFHVSATAVNAVLATTINYAGSPTAILTPCTAGDACTPTMGGMTLPGSAASGIYSTLAAAYNEVGAFNLQLQDTTFAAADTSDTPGDCTPGGRYVCSQVLGVGRFVPDHFALAYNMPVFDGACSGNVAGEGFTYIGQTFNYATAPVITVEAQNSANATTALYTGSWWRITNASLTGKSYTTASGALDISGLPVSDPAISNPGGGVGTLTFSSGTGLFFTRTAPVAPFDAEIGLAINVIDADGVAFAGNPASFGAATLGNGIDFINGKHMRFGRLRLSNTFGSSAPLLMPVEAQYWSGLSWVKNSDDSCTTLANDNLLLDPAGWSAMAPGILSAGSGNISLSPTGTGSVTVCADLGSDNGFPCLCISANRPWLQSRWPGGNDYNNDPSARATFGIYAPETRKTIHIREQF